MGDGGGACSSAAVKMAGILIVARLLRFVRLGMVCCTSKVELTRATRRLVSQNRRRFKDYEFDLDLTYVTDGMIAMSLPAHKKKDVLYRNDIHDVSRFFRTRHTDHFKVYNVTSERRYDHSLFDDAVVTLDIDDHNPPPLLQVSY